MGLIKEILVKDDIRIMSKPDYVSYSDIQDCLNKAHAVNERNGLIYATKNQTVEKLIEKLKDSVTYVALSSENKVIATASVQFRKINYWYHNGDIALLKLVGVLPEYSGKKLALLLLQLLRTFEVQSRGIEVIVSDSAEENIAIRNLYLNNEFKIVDCCKYTSNNFISTVYAYWFHGCPHKEEKLLEEYRKHRNELMKCL